MKIRPKIANYRTPLDCYENLIRSDLFSYSSRRSEFTDVCILTLMHIFLSNYKGRCNSTDMIFEVFLLDGSNSYFPKVNRPLALTSEW